MVVVGIKVSNEMVDGVEVVNTGGTTGIQRGASHFNCVMTKYDGLFIWLISNDFVQMNYSCAVMC